MLARHAYQGVQTFSFTAGPTAAAAAGPVLLLAPVLLSQLPPLLLLWLLTRLLLLLCMQTDTTFTVNFITVVPFFKVTESVPLNGGAAQLSRRDLRPGKQQTTARAVPEGVLVEMSWGAPFEGT